MDYLVNEQSNEKQQDEPKAVVYAPDGKIAITTFDQKQVVMCQAVKGSEILFNGKGPKYILNGVDGISFWGEHSVILGWYLKEEELQ